MGLNLAGINAACNVALPLVAWLLVGAFGLWLLRRVPTRSGTFLVLLWLFQFPLIYKANLYLLGLYLRADLHSDILPGSLSFLHWSAIDSILGTVSKVLPVLLVASELAALLVKAGVPIDDRAARLLLPLRSSRVLGIIAVVLVVFSQYCTLLFSLCW
jgi:hypothetical protein